MSLDGCPEFEIWLVGERERWRQRVARVLGELITHHSQRGDYQEGLRFARRLLALEPWREETHRQAMRLLAHSDQRGAALAQYETCRRVLAEELGVEPGPETTQLYEQIRDGELAGPAPAPPPPLPVERRHNLPSWPTPLVGRQAELGEIARFLRDPDCRLLTLVGPPGVGKTRLGSQAAAELLADAEPTFADGIFFVALAPLRDPALVGPTIAQVLGVSVDSAYCHRAWINTPRDQNGIEGLKYPLGSDITKQVSRDYGVLVEDKGVALRGLFIIDPHGTLQYQVVHNEDVGRSADETLRVLQALQSGGLCPLNWKPGEAHLQA